MHFQANVRLPDKTDFYSELNVCIFFRTSLVKLRTVDLISILKLNLSTGVDHLKTPRNLTVHCHNAFGLGSKFLCSSMKILVSVSRSSLITVNSLLSSNFVTLNFYFVINLICFNLLCCYIWVHFYFALTLLK